MKRVDMYEGERFISDDEIIALSEKLLGKRNPDYHDFLKIMEYFKAKGERVCCVFSAYLMHSDQLEELKAAGDKFYTVLEKGSFMYVDPIESLADFEKEVSSLGDFRDPNNKMAYIKVMFKVTKMYDEGITIPMDMGPVRGTFTGKYPPCVFDAIKAIVKKYLPSIDTFIDENDNLREEFESDREFYIFLANFVNNPIMLAEMSPFLDVCQRAGVRYNSPKDINEIQKLSEESMAFVDEAPSL